LFLIVASVDNPFGDLSSYGPTESRYKESGSIIAVSYEARAKGVTRAMRGNEAKKVIFLFPSDFS
jgi:hypothetical protein